jgi:uncharacterized small protein (TIGR04563 family)
MPTSKKSKSKGEWADPRKVSVSLSEDVLQEMTHEAKRQDRSLSGIAQMAWKLARDRIKAYGQPLAV